MAFEPVIKNGFPLIIERDGVLVPAVDDAPDCEDCCPESGIWDWYHEYADAGYTPPSVIGTENFARTAAVYYESALTLDDIDSYPDWFVTITDTNWDAKGIIESLAPLGVTSTELVYYRTLDADTSEVAWMGVNAQSRTVLWIRADDDWSPDPEIGSGARIEFVGTLSGTIDYDVQIPKHLQEGAGGLGCGPNGVFRWVYTSDVFSIWQLPAQTYEPYPFPTGWGDVGGAFSDPIYTYSNVDFNAIYDEEGTGNLREFNEYFMPIAQPPQSDLTVGAKRGFLAGLPETLAEFEATNDYTATIEFNLGTLQVDDDDIPFVNGSVIWQFAAEHYHHAGGESADISSGSIEAQIDRIDARSSSSRGGIAVITYKYTTAFGGDVINGFFSTDIDIYTVLVIDGGEISNRLMVRVEDIDSTPTYAVDRRAYYPQWHHVRCLQPSELAQGGGTRNIALERVPLNPAEAIEYDGFTDLAQTRLRCYHNASLEYSITSRWGRFFQASGNGALETTTSNAGLLMEVVAGGCADYAAINMGMNITIEDDTPEDAIYDRGSRHLTVKVDISGGNNTVDDVIAVINAAGDFQASTPPFGAGSNIIEDGNTGSCSFSNGFDRGGTGAASNAAYVNDSSNRYYYIHNFPMRVRELVNNRWTCYFIQGTFTYPRTWMISHNGEVKIPCGFGENNWDREQPGSTHPVAGSTATSYCCVKNCNLIPLCPPLFAENFHNICDSIPEGEAPTVTIIIAPPNGTSTTAFIQWTTTGLIELQEIQLDGAALAPYVGNSITYTNLQPTDPSFHVFGVRVENEFGFAHDFCQWQQGGTPPPPPTVTITQAPDDPTTNTTASFAWTTTGTIDATVCILDGVESNCSSPVTYTDLEPGEHEFTVRVSNTGGTDEDDHDWEIEEPAPGAPTVTITVKPPSQGTNNDVTFEWTTTGDIDSTTCQLTPGATGACTSPKNYNDLTPGTYTFKVTVANGSGSDFDEWTFEILEEAPDPPTVTITTAPSTTTDSPNATFDWSTTGFVENTVCELDGVETDPCAKPKSYTGLADGEHTFRVTVSNDGGSDFDEHEWTIETSNCTKVQSVVRYSGGSTHVDVEVTLASIIPPGCATNIWDKTFLFTGPSVVKDAGCFHGWAIENFQTCTSRPDIQTADIEVVFLSHDSGELTGPAIFVQINVPPLGNFAFVANSADALLQQLLAGNSVQIPFDEAVGGTATWNFTSATCTIRVFPT